MDLLSRVFESQNIKIFSLIVEEEIVPYFCGRDACQILEYLNYRQALYDNVEDDCKISLKDLLGVSQKLTPQKVKFTHNELQQTYINEEGLYRLMFHCKLPVAKKFQKWIFKEVFPTIRKTGKFELKNALKSKEEELSLAMTQLAIKEKSHEEETKELEERLEQEKEARLKAEKEAKEQREYSLILKELAIEFLKKL